MSPNQSLAFPSADHFKYKTLKYVRRHSPSIVVIEGSHIQYIDSTVAKVSDILPVERIAFRINQLNQFELQAVCATVEDLHLLNKVVYFWNWNRDAMVVLCRLNAKMSALFKYASCEGGLVHLLNTENAVVEVVTD